MSVKQKKIRLRERQPGYARQLLRQVRRNGVALLQLPTGQGKTLITLKAIAELLRHARNPRPVILVTTKRLDSGVFESALRGELQGAVDIAKNPWVRDACRCGGLEGLCKGKKPKLAYAECWGRRDISNYRPPLGAIVIIDEVHQFSAFLQHQADKAAHRKSGVQPSNSKRRQYILLSATPINPTRIYWEEQRRMETLEQQEEEENRFIRASYLNLYRTMISLSYMRETKKCQLLGLLDDETESSLEEFAEKLRRVMAVLAPIPGPEVLCSLGPKGKPPYVPQKVRTSPAECHRSVKGLLAFHETIANDLDLYYCAERMALAGVVSKPGTSSAGFVQLPKYMRRKGHAHYQPSLPYAPETIAALQALYRKEPVRQLLLTGKVDALYSFLKGIWSNRRGKRKWRVLVYCAHRGSVAALAAELERRFVKDGIRCGCRKSYTVSWLYGRHGGNRVVLDTEGYSGDMGSWGESKLIEYFGLPREQCRKGDSCPLGYVLVTSDRLSESINLHDCCEVMVHFDLDWSPLRMIQRFGRLWRIDSAALEESRSIQRPQRPAVFHMIQPGSVDEEILWRLENRWSRLEALKLGLEIVSRKDALGERIYGYSL